MYEEDYVRLGSGGHKSHAHHPGEAWNALADFAKKFMEEYYPEDEEMHRSYHRYAYDEPEHARYRGQPRTSTGRFKSMRYSHEHEACEMDKREIGSMLAHTHGRDWMIEKAIKEASEFIAAASKEDEYEMFKEFCELCVIMKGFAEFVPAELEEQACEKALAYYAKKAEHMRYSNPLLDEYSRRSRMY